MSYFEKKVLPQAAKLPGTSGLFKNNHVLRKKFCPRQRSCPGHVACLKKVIFKRSPAPGSEAARDKWLIQKKHFLRKVLPQAAQLPGTRGLFKNKKNMFLRKSSAPGSEAARDKSLLQKHVDFLAKVLPQAAKLPVASGFFKKK